MHCGNPPWLWPGNIYRVGPKESRLGGVFWLWKNKKPSIINAMPKKIFIGVAWPYVNGDLHIGHLAGYLLPADIFARFHRFLGNDVLMVSGSDCYGTPITIEADKRKKKPEDIVREYHPRNVALFKEAGISFDLYTKTTTENHKEIVQNFFLEFLKKGLIKRGWSKQYYAPKEKKFLPDRYVEGMCPHCKNRDARSDQCDVCGRLLEQGDLIEPKSKLSGSGLELKDTEHYFLDWPQLEPFLKDYVKTRSPAWREWVKNETIGWLEKGLQPRAITRDMDWGIELPIERIPENERVENIKKKKIYVWFEAVIGYLSASVEWAREHGKEAALRNFWYGKDAEHYYFMGKDNLIFHTLFWPGELRAYNKDLHLPDVPAINHFLNLEGRKLSKSRGVSIDSAYIIETYGVDAVRFYLASIMPETTDANFSWTEFIYKTNSVLIGNLGNFINRTIALGQGAKLEKKLIEKKTEKEVIKRLDQGKNALEHTKFKEYVENMLALSNFGNKYFSKAEPWKDKDHDATGSFRKVLTNCIYITLGLQVLMKPLLPEAVKKLETLTGVSFAAWPEGDVIKNSISGVELGKAIPLFQKIDPIRIEQELAKLPIEKPEERRVRG
ncbi:MAG: methionine--tRNA ligase [Nanoarchaeota archaeon]|nr:methionine--tRNA ligase [Nanoarchaeota archaeon]